MNRIKLGNRIIYENSKPYIIAEMVLTMNAQYPKQKNLYLKQKWEEPMLQNFKHIKQN